MKIGLQTWGTDGDIRPFIALAGGLSASGHDVSLVTTSVHNKEYYSYGNRLDFAISHVGKINLDPKTVSDLHEKLRITKIPIKQLQIVMENFFDPVIPEMYEASKKLCSENDVVIGHFLHHPAMTAAEKSGKPYISISLNHGGIPSKHTVPAGCPKLGELINPFWWKFSNLIVDHALGTSINKLRRDESLPPVRNIMASVWISKHLNLLSVSPHLCEKQPDWSENNKICGFLNIPEQVENWNMPEELRQFIEKGPPPVFLTIGSMLDLDKSPGKITEILVKGALLAGCRAIVQSCWGELPDFPDHPNIFKVKNVPHQHIFPSCAAVVHHGGAGTSQSATLSGCPSVVIEHFGDQTLFANELRRLGVAPKVLHRRCVTEKKLAKAIKFVLDSPDMKKRAEKISKHMKKENGVRRAVDIIESSFGSSSPK
jgi:UDP:flavonoid glycosyltransferase YjiC (YdhE family)